MTFIGSHIIWRSNNALAINCQEIQVPGVQIMTKSSSFSNWLSRCRSITAKNFLTSVQSYLEKHEKHSPYLSSMVTCRRDNSLKEVIMKLDSMKIHRIYVVDDKGNLEGVITLRDIISKLVHEPRGYFGDFFDGVLPLPANSRV